MEGSRVRWRVCIGEQISEGRGGSVGEHMREEVSGRREVG